MSETTCREMIAAMPGVFKAEVAGDLAAEIYFHVTGEEPGDYYLHIAEGTCTFHEGVPESPTVTIDAPSDVWLAISKGELDATAAFMQQKFRASGDFNLLLKMNQIFVPDR